MAKVKSCKYCGTGHVPRQCPAYSKNMVSVGNRTILMWYVSQCIGSRRAVHRISQEEKSHSVKQGDQERSFDVVKYINLDSMKSVILT